MQAGQVAYWIMQSQYNDPCGFTGIADSAQHGTVTGSCSAAGATNDPLITFNALVLSTNVPPVNMFMSGYGPGTNSYNAESLNGQNGALFFPQDQYGNEFTTNLGGSWTFEMFFETDGNQSGNGIEELLMNHENSLFYILDLNESAAGGLRLAIYDGSGFPTVDLTGHNFADGNWYYVACSFNHTNNLMTILCRSQSGVVYSNSVTTPGPPVEGTAGNLFIGRNDYNNDSGARNFNGLIANVAISSGVVPNSQLIGVINGSTTTAVSSSLNPAVYGQSVNFTAIVTNSAAGVPSGTVTFMDGVTALGAGILNGSGVATYTNNSLSVAGSPHSITAVYGGDNNFNGSSSAVLSQVVNKATPTATLMVNNSPVTYDGTAKAATVGISVSSVPGSVASILTGGASTQTSANTYTVTASFVPIDSTDYNTLTGLSAGSFVINKATPTISGVTGSQSISYGTASVTLSGIISAGSGYPANGESVSVTINGSTQNATISGGAGGLSVSFPTATIPPAPTAYTITYAYAGDANLNAAANNTGTTLTVTGISVPNLSYTNSPGLGLRILLSDITANAGTKSSLSSPTYSITGTSASSTQSGTVAHNSSTILYTPPNNTTSSDTFTYTLTDGSATATATVTVTFVSPTGPTLSPTIEATHPVIQFYGIFGQGYHIQRSSDLSNWADVQAALISSNGAGFYIWTDSVVTVPPSNVYYRVRYP